METLKKKALKTLNGDKLCVCQDIYGFKFVLSMIDGEPCSYDEDTDEWIPVGRWTVSDDYEFKRYHLNIDR